MGMDIINSSVGYISGFNGIILKTTNGGEIGIKPISENIPTEFKLNQNYPNPFNPATNIEFDIPKSSYVKLNVYDILGKEITVLVDEFVRAGRYKVTLNAEKFTTGIYIYKLATENFIQTKKMILLK